MTQAGFFTRLIIILVFICVLSELHKIAIVIEKHNGLKMAYWFAPKDDDKPFQGKDILVFSSLSQANRYSTSLEAVNMQYMFAPEGVSAPSKTDIETMHAWYNVAGNFVSTWKRNGITEDLQTVIMRTEAWLTKHGRKFSQPIDFNVDAKSPPPDIMLFGLNRFVTEKSLQPVPDRYDSCNDVQSFFTEMDPFVGSYQTEQEWYDFFAHQWKSNPENTD